MKCHDPGLNQGPLDLQNNALATELSRLQFGQYGARTHDIRVISTTLQPTELSGPVHQRENAFKVTNIKHSLWWFVLMASLVEVNFIWIFRVSGTHIKYKQTAIAQFVLVSGIRCSFSQRNVVRASANVMLLTSLENTKQQHMLEQNISQWKTKLFRRLKFFSSTHSTVTVKNNWVGQISQLVFRKRNKCEKTICDKRWLRRSTPHADPKDLHSRVVFTFALQALQALTKK